MHAISKPISHIYNASLNQGIYPNRLKFTIVKGGKIAPSNFKSISLFTTFSKTSENVMYNRLSQHLRNENCDT